MWRLLVPMPAMTVLTCSGFNFCPAKIGCTKIAICNKTPIKKAVALFFNKLFIAVASSIYCFLFSEDEKWRWNGSKEKPQRHKGHKEELKIPLCVLCVFVVIFFLEREPGAKLELTRRERAAETIGSCYEA